MAKIVGAFFPLRSDHIHFLCEEIFFHSPLESIQFPSSFQDQHIVSSESTARACEKKINVTSPFNVHLNNKVLVLQLSFLVQSLVNCQHKEISFHRFVLLRAQQKK